MSSPETPAFGSGFALGEAEEREGLGYVPGAEDGPEGSSRHSSAAVETRNPPFPPYPAPVAEIAVPPPRSALPGGGDYGPGCGAKVGLGWIAPADGCFPVGFHRCERRACPRCGKAHTERECPFGLAHGGGDLVDSEARAAVAKLEGYGFSVGVRTFRQVVVSPPAKRYAESDGHARTIHRVRRAARAALRALAPVGWRWGSVVVHLYRGCEAEGYGRWGPHAHVVCPGIDVRKVVRYADKTGVVVKQVNDRSGRFAEYRGFELARHLVYELGHAGTVPNGHSISYVGADLIAHEVPEPAPTEEERTPPTCPHGHPFSILGRGARPRYDPLTREWAYAAEHGEFFRFLDRAPAQGGPILERVRRSGEAVHVPISPYLARDLRPPPYVGRKRAANFSSDDQPPPVEAEAEPLSPPWGRRPACVACHSRWKPGDGELRCPHLPPPGEES